MSSSLLERFRRVKGLVASTQRLYDAAFVGLKTILRSEGVDLKVDDRVVLDTLSDLREELGEIERVLTSETVVRCELAMTQLRQAVHEYQNFSTGLGDKPESWYSARNRIIVAAIDLAQISVESVEVSPVTPSEGPVLKTGPYPPILGPRYVASVKDVPNVFANVSRRAMLGPDAAPAPSVFGPIGVKIK